MVMELYFSRAVYKDLNGKTRDAPPFPRTVSALFHNTQPNWGAELTQTTYIRAVHASRSTAAPPSRTASAPSSTY